jgi:hypothetical protein
MMASMRRAGLLLLCVSGLGAQADKLRPWYTYPRINPWDMDAPAPGRHMHTMLAVSETETRPSVALRLRIVFFRLQTLGWRAAGHARASARLKCGLIC